MQMNHYTSQSEVRRPAKLIGAMAHDLFASRHLAAALLRRDLHAKYRQTVLGFMWAFLPSLFTSLAFTLAISAKAISFPPTGMPYPAFVIFNMVLWQTFLEAINGPIQTISESKVMLAKINFKREALIISKFGEVWVGFAIKLLLLAGVLIYYQIPVASTLLLAVLPVTVLILFGLLIGIVLSPFSLIYKDITYGIAVFTNFFLFVTPVIYPKPTEGLLSKLVNLNPVTHCIEAARKLIIDLGPYDFYPFYITAAAVLFTFFFAWLIFRLAMPYAIERVTS